MTLLAFVLRAAGHPPDYHTYIKSRAWRRRRAKYFRRHARRCAACNTRRDIQLHHHTYQRLGRERDNDLIPLCRKHHMAVHAFHDALGGTLTDATFNYLRATQRRHGLR